MCKQKVLSMVAQNVLKYIQMKMSNPLKSGTGWMCSLKMTCYQTLMYWNGRNCLKMTVKKVKQGDKVGKGAQKSKTSALK